MREMDKMTDSGKTPQPFFTRGHSEGNPILRAFRLHVVNDFNIHSRAHEAGFWNDDLVTYRFQEHEYHRGRTILERIEDRNHALGRVLREHKIQPRDPAVQQARELLYRYYRAFRRTEK